MICSSVPVKVDGSSKLQWMRVPLPGNTGHWAAEDSSQTVTT